MSAEVKFSTKSRPQMSNFPPKINEKKKETGQPGNVICTRTVVGWLVKTSFQAHFNTLQNLFGSSYSTFESDTTVQVKIK